ncbi:MAG: hypothetical protein NZ602_03595 [Thermoguttaceae bacterium]|nr:hypothetical protein [Thermoguttaceae bacterium]MDW8039591.1 hypothetical protein [Thermoguttaceae bacterium]
MNSPMEDLQKRLEIATTPGAGEPRAQSAGQTEKHPESLDAELAQWQEVWQAFGRLLDASEQSLPEPAWKQPSESSTASAPRPSCRQVELANASSRTRWFRWVVAAVGGLALVSGGLVVWWTAQPASEGTNQIGLTLTNPHEASQSTSSTFSGALQTKSSPCPTSSQSAWSAEKVVANAPGPANVSTVPPSGNLPTFSWDDQWEQTILSIEQISRQIEGYGLFQNDPFTGIREKIQEIQTELEQEML